MERNAKPFQRVMLHGFQLESDDVNVEQDHI